MTTITRQRRGRPSKADVARIDRQILDAAWNTFLELGFEGATIELIAERAGVTKTTLYLRHADKTVLLHATVTDRMKTWSVQYDRYEWFRGTSLEERLVNLGTRLLHAAGNPELLATTRLTQGTVGEAGRIARELDRFIREPMIEELAVDIAECALAEGIAVRDPKAIARFFIGMLESMIDRHAPDYDDPERHAALSRQVVAILFRGQSEW
ncbi:TetR/AcrR family transcriptional regulator [Novosphingobium sp. TH158]|uniref:TetR/AcrR family transcriptional regulator n=1 Tax=Novosphingobium sp. TH158 TaxID=2067455 RepID=UPI001303F8DB|nr:TetR/AcrR family transcriptional regulator [Novosphingobium sp. TH158]